MHRRKCLYNTMRPYLINQNILFVGAHPDDVELGCGGTLIKSLNENINTIYVVILSKGENGVSIKNNTNRIDESLNGLISIGLQKKNIFTYSISDTNFNNNRKKIFHILEKIIIQKQITTIFTHTNKEYHQDHIVIYEETLRAARNVGNIFLYETNAHTYSSYAPIYFIDVSKYINSKINLLNYHTSQKTKKYFSDENVKSLAKFRGNQSRHFQYAEGFEPIRIINQ